MQAALDRLGAAAVRLRTVSPVYENRAVGMGEADPFLNAIAAIETGLEPLALLDLCLTVESELGRIRTGTWAPRTIDLDIVAYNDLTLVGGQLNLPHPRIEERDFVLRPLCDVAPNLIIRGQRVEDLAAALPMDGLTRCECAIHVAEMKELKQGRRDVIAPQEELGHSGRNENEV
jgi:2-amino-4-hydroxy-6-hydroxymethyldihydropteridine diphosphokinase